MALWQRAVTAWSKSSFMDRFIAVTGVPVVIIGAANEHQQRNVNGRWWSMERHHLSIVREFCFASGVFVLTDKYIQAIINKDFSNIRFLYSIAIVGGAFYSTYKIEQIDREIR